MPRTVRVNSPGTVYHLISRFVDRHWFIEADAERETYLRLLGNALQRSDWRCLAYAVMSNHIHLAMIAGEQPLGPVMRAAHSPFAHEMNIKRERIGPMFVRGPKDYAIPDAQVAQLVAYIHNNPVRAGVVKRAADSRWTSHAAYLNVRARPAWLDVEDGLARCGVSDASELARFVDADHTTRAELAIGPIRAAARRHGAIEVSTPTAAVRAIVPLVARPWAHVRVDPRDVVNAVAAHLQVPLEALCSRRRTQTLVEGRRLAVHCGVRVGLTASDMGAALGISQQAATKLLRRALDAEHAAACVQLSAALLGSRRLTASLAG